MKIVSPAEASKFFDEWSIYNQILDRDYMLHDEIYRDVQRFFAERYGDRPFSLLDLGCGSARHLAQALQGRSLNRYVGFDLSDVALAHAKHNLAGLGCAIELHQGDLLEGLKKNHDDFDVIFTSFALHHLSAAEKTVFFQLANEKLNQDGILLVIDTMREDGEDRGRYLDRYCAWLRSRCKTLSVQALDLLCEHIRANDFPESTVDLNNLAMRAGFGAHVEINRFRWHHTWYFGRAGNPTEQADQTRA